MNLKKYSISILLSFIVLSGILFLAKHDNDVVAGSQSVILDAQSDWSSGAKEAVDLDEEPGSILLIKEGGVWAYENSMLSSQEKHCAVYYNNLIYIFGDESDDIGVQTYNPSTDEYQAKTSYPLSDGGHFISEVRCGLVGNKVYVIADHDGFLGFNYEYDISSDSWQQKASPLAYGASPSPEADFAATSLGGYIYVLGGHDPDQPYSDVERYNPDTDSWEYVSNMNHARADLTATTYNGELYALGGYTDDSELGLITGEKYNPSTNTWTNIANMNTGGRRLASTTYKSKIYIMGGHDNSYNEQVNFEEYEPTTNTWTTKSNMLSAKVSPAASTDGSKIYLFGGGTIGGSGTGTTTNQSWPNDPTYSSPGTHTTASTQIDGQEGSADKTLIEWETFTPTQTTPANTSISYEFRTSANGTDWTSWSAPQTYSGSPLDLTTLTPNRYLQVRATLSTTDALATPQIDDYTVNFHNNQKPNKPVAQTVTFD